MDFPDLSHLLQLQKDLWQWPNSRAAVMVGAGFSLNAVQSSGVSARFPTWRELAQAMFDEIYPAPPNETDEQRNERETQFNQSNALRLASEYEAQFERPKLESLLRERIPDTDHQPGDLHHLLLKLPWKDVFTTDYDTLLERTEVPGRVYQPVKTINDLTIAFSPRIIKLHGSFPSHTPFIITEEDYRTYPKRFSPFVNTVRQSLIENTFVLIGFSGDDPNFLEWTGWIRDELGNHHAPIYLVGPLSLTIVQRSLLTQRGVTPIDLTPVFSGINLHKEIHLSAIEWFLRSLLAAKPQRSERWPKAKMTAKQTTNFKPPILTSGLSEPAEISLASFRGPLDETTVIKVIKRWRFERKQYPGWLVATDEMRSLLWNRTYSWITPLFKFSENWKPADRILIFREINWRLEVSMIPVFSDLISPFESAVNELFPKLKEGMPAKLSVKAMISIVDSNNGSVTEVAEAWLEITFALVREARESYNAERWESIKKKIDQVVVNYPQFTDRYHYEQALWRMWNIERNQAKEILAKWAPAPHSPLAMMWKAGILIDLDEWSEARSLLQTALREIRKSLHNTRGRNIRLLSLEGWCTYSLSPVKTPLSWIGTSDETFALIEEFSERWQELKVQDCDPRPLIKYFDKELAKTPPVPKKSKKVIHEFDPWHRNVNYSLGGSFQWRPAFAFIRLYEQVGHPMCFPSDTLKHASEWLAPFIDFWSPILLVIAGKKRELTEHGFMSRTQVACMHSDVARSWSKWAVGALTRVMTSLNDSIAKFSVQASLLGGLVEVLSRLAFKLESVDLQESFSLALELHNQTGISSHDILHNSCESWFERLYEAADDQQLLAWLPALIRFPLYSENVQSVNHHLDPWPDPMRDFPVERLRIAKETSSELGAERNEAIEWLLERAKSESGKGRQRAVMRLTHIFYTNLMSKNQQGDLGTLLWEKTSTNGLPDLPNLPYVNYLNLPVPAAVDVVSKIKEYLSTLTPIEVSSDAAGNIRGPEAEDRMILEVAFASKSIVQLPYESKGIIEWSLEETRELWQKMIEWWESVKVVLVLEKPSSYPLGTERITSSLEYLGTFLARVVLPKMDSASEDEWKQVLGLLSEVREHEIYLTTTLPYILLHRSSEGDKVMRTILNDLSSGEEKAVEASAKAVRHWVYLADADHLDNSTDDVVDKLIERVVFRRPEGVLTCLDQLTLLLIEKPSTFTAEQVNLMVNSLIPWHGATCLPLSEEREGDFPEEERPELRTLLGRLTSALRIWLKNELPDKPEPPEIAQLRESYKSDPLPEVRRSLEWWKFFKKNSSD